MDNLETGSGTILSSFGFVITSSITSLFKSGFTTSGFTTSIEFVLLISLFGYVILFIKSPIFGSSLLLLLLSDGCVPALSDPSDEGIS